MVQSNDLERCVHRAYEYGRWRYALVRAIPTVAVGLVVALISPAGWMVALPGPLLLLGLLFFFWRGEGLGVGAHIGFLSGLVPLAASLLARHVHGCGPLGCSSWCVPACALGGAVAAILVARFAHRTADSTAYWFSASVVATLTGSLACGCVGLTGIVALLLTYSLGSFPAKYALSRA